MHLRPLRCVAFEKVSSAALPPNPIVRLLVPRLYVRRAIRTMHPSCFGRGGLIPGGKTSRGRRRRSRSSCLGPWGALGGV